MNNELIGLIMETRHLELQHTLDTRQIAFDRDRALIAGIAALVRVLHLNGTINAEEAKAVYDAMSIKKEVENDD